MSIEFPSQLYPIIFFLFTFLAWVGSCVSFGGVLAVMSFEGFSFDCYYDHIVGVGRGWSYSDFSAANNFAHDCESGGKGLVAMQVFAFLSTLATMIINALRLSGKNIMIPSAAFQSTEKLISMEIALTAVTVFFYFISIVVWGASCYGELGKAAAVSATGFAYIIVCFFFEIFAAVIGIMTSKQLAAAGGVGAGAGAGGYNKQNDEVPQHDSAASAASAPHSSLAGGYSSYHDHSDAPPTNPNV